MLNEHQAECREWVSTSLETFNILSLSRMFIWVHCENINARGSVVFNTKKNDSSSSRMLSLFTVTFIHCSSSSVNRSTSEMGLKSSPIPSARKFVLHRMLYYDSVMFAAYPVQWLHQLMTSPIWLHLSHPNHLTVICRQPENQQLRVCCTHQAQNQLWMLQSTHIITIQLYYIRIRRAILCNCWNHLRSSSLINTRMVSDGWKITSCTGELRTIRKSSITSGKLLSIIV